MATELKEHPGGVGAFAVDVDVDFNGSSSSQVAAPAYIPKDELPLLISDLPVSDDPFSATAAETMEELEKDYAPFVRRDVYGPMGRGKFPMAEKARLAVAALTIFPVRVALAMLFLVVYYAICWTCTLFSSPNREDGQEDYARMIGWRREVVVRSGRFISRAVLFVFGFYRISVTQRGFFNEGEYKEQIAESERPGVIVSNHVSYVDILYHMSSSFPSFVAKISVTKIPLVGLISKCLGCVYVQRELKSSDCKGVSGIVIERIQEADRNKMFPKMLLFPEGTTTNGNYLLPFKSGAFLAKVSVLPVILKYPYTRFSPAWDSMSGVRHLLLLLCQFVNYMEVIQLPVYFPSELDEDPKVYAQNVRKLIATEGNLILAEMGLPEKRFYLAALNGNGLPRGLHQKDDCKKIK